jgi:hypothetical protein
LRRASMLPLLDSQSPRSTGDLRQSICYIRCAVCRPPVRTSTSGGAGPAASTRSPSPGRESASTATWTHVWFSLLPSDHPFQTVAGGPCCSGAETLAILKTTSSRTGTTTQLDSEIPTWFNHA